MTAERNQHSRLLSPEDAERWRERVRHGTAPNGVLVMVDEIERLYEQYKHLENELDDMTGQFCNEAIHLTRAEDRVRELEEQYEALRVELEGGSHEGDKGLRREYQFTLEVARTWANEARRLQEQLEARAADAARWERDWHRAQDELRIAAANANRRREEDGAEIHRLSRVAEQYRIAGERLAEAARILDVMLNEPAAEGLMTAEDYRSYVGGAWLGIHEALEAFAEVLRPGTKEQSDEA